MAWVVSSVPESHKFLRVEFEWLFVDHLLPPPHAKRIVSYRPCVYIHSYNGFGFYAPQY